MHEKKAQWKRFSRKVLDHIRYYVIPQYGDNPDDMIEDYTIDDIKAHLTRYVHRIGKNSRGIQEAKRDCIKIAHYACYLLEKIEEERK